MIKIMNSIISSNEFAMLKKKIQIWENYFLDLNKNENKTRYKFK